MFLKKFLQRFLERGSSYKGPHRKVPSCRGTSRKVPPRLIVEVLPERFLRERTF
jgi:hypothetical protein